MWPTEACTSYSGPRYFAIVFAFAGDSTITSFFVPGTVLLLRTARVLCGPPIPHTIHTAVGPSAQRLHRETVGRTGVRGRRKRQAEGRDGHLDPHVRAGLTAPDEPRSIRPGRLRGPV